ncbi:carbamoyltransferase C-terminal domain-containing protein [Micromonospora sp. WMMA1976]|uniref:carbamoyltransferase C-terminal domain-containing protein n=1 Tax=Micromonospora sp. WMMA1976 TaxID=3014995 RepID=UPI00248BB294|nr:carbamoyltransferase C-terminal domain-containing protein [Micromonospora sp. WMMA1976]WBC01101.1 hypothetical protein O7546_18210 [Micromonospora sp. WMMA1976]
MTRILGYNLSHDSSICLIEDGQIRAASALERVSRVKRGVVPVHAYPAAMAALTRDVLGDAGLVPDQIDHWIVTSTESCDQDDEDRLADSLGLLVPADRRLSLPHPGHHLAHASAAFYTSGFDEASALVIDAYGSRTGEGREQETGFLFRLGDTPRRVLSAVRPTSRIAGRLQPDGTLSVPAKLSGVGEIYRVVTLALGFFESGTYDDAGKTMGLAPYGRRLSAENLFITAGPDGLSFDRAADSLIELGLATADGDALRLLPRGRREPLGQFHRDLAAQLQLEFEDACLHLVEELIGRTRVRSLVLGGGCFLNSVFNARLLRESVVERLSVFPAATDDGNAVGAALYAHHVLLGGKVPSPAERKLRHVYLGPSRVAGRDVPALASKMGLTAVQHESDRVASRAAASAIAEGQIIGWFSDRGELGPRALGARSILCHPGISGMKDKLNARVKFREAFRPFAAAVLSEQAAKWFEIANADSPFMLQVWPVAEAARQQVAEIVHVDGTCRIQTVDRDLPGSFRVLLEELDAITGIPVVLNTSFNLRGMPIVEHVEEALDCLYGSRMDRLFIGSVEVEAPDLTRLRPVALTGTGADADDFRAAWHEQADGQRTVRDIAAAVGMDPEALVDEVLNLRRLGRMRWEGVPQLQAPRYPLPQYEPQAAGR